MYIHVYLYIYSFYVNYPNVLVLGLHSLGRVLQRLWYRPAGHRSFCKVTGGLLWGDRKRWGKPWFPLEKIYTWWVKTTLICYFTEGYTFWWWRIIKIITIMSYELKIITIMSWDGDELKSPHLCHDIYQPQRSPKNLSTFPVDRFYSWTRWPNSFCKICLASFATETVSDRVIIVHPAKEIIEWINREDGYCRTHCRWLIFVGSRVWIWFQCW